MIKKILLSSLILVLSAITFSAYAFNFFDYTSTVHVGRLDTPYGAKIDNIQITPGPNVTCKAKNYADAEQKVLGTCQMPRNKPAEYKVSGKLTLFASDNVRGRICTFSFTVKNQDAEGKIGVFSTPWDVDVNCTQPDEHFFSVDIVHDHMNKKDILIEGVFRG